jgi:hypothetical protein
MAVRIDARSSRTGNRLPLPDVARKRKQVVTEALANKMAPISIFVMSFHHLHELIHGGEQLRSRRQSIQSNE